MPLPVDADLSRKALKLLNHSALLYCNPTLDDLQTQVQARCSKEIKSFANDPKIPFISFRTSALSSKRISCEYNVRPISAMYVTVLAESTDRRISSHSNPLCDLAAERRRDL